MIIDICNGHLRNYVHEMIQQTGFGFVLCKFTACLDHPPSVDRNDRTDDEIWDKPVLLVFWSIN